MRARNGPHETFTCCAGAQAEGTLKWIRMAATGSGQPCRTVNTADMRSPRFTRARTPLSSNFSVNSVHATETAPSSSIASRA